MVEGHFTSGASSRMGPPPAVEHGHAFPGAVVQPAMQPSSTWPMPAPIQWSPSLIPANHDFGDFAASFMYERASGTSQAVDSIALTLSQQHLHTETETARPMDCAPNCIAAMTIPLIDTCPPVDALSQKPICLSDSRAHPATSIPPGPTLSTILPKLTSDSSTRPTMDNDKNSVWRKRSTEMSGTTQDSLVEYMISSGTQCNVQASSVSNVGPREAYSLEPMESGPRLEVDHIVTENVEPQNPTVHSSLGMRHAMKPSGISKKALLAYRSSRDTALQCRNLVKSQPRMRKRVKVRKKEDLPATPSVAGSPVASITAARRGS